MALIDQGIDPNERRCQFHTRTHVEENSGKARDVAMAAITRYDAISRIGRKSVKPETAIYDWDGMLGSGRNLYGNPDQCIEIIHNAMRHYYFNILTTTFNFGGIPHAPVRQRGGAGVSLSERPAAFRSAERLDSCAILQRKKATMPSYRRLSPTSQQLLSFQVFGIAKIWKCRAGQGSGRPSKTRMAHILTFENCQNVKVPGAKHDHGDKPEPHGHDPSSGAKPNHCFQLDQID